MSDTGRLLRFQPRDPVSPFGNGETLARKYLDLSIEQRPSELISGCMGDPDAVLILLVNLRSLLNTSPTLVSEEAAQIHAGLSEKPSFGLFDEREYCLGEAALLVGSAYRLLGEREKTEMWLDRADSMFRHTVNPAPGLANVAYVRLSLHYDSGRYDRVLDLVASLASSFQKLGMKREALKSGFLKAMALKDSSRIAAARETLEGLASHPDVESEAGIKGLVLVNIGDLVAQGGDSAEALRRYREATPYLTGQPIALAQLKGVMGELLRQEGNLADAAECFRASIVDYATIGMQTTVAYLRIVLSETLIALGQHREAEWEILTALPTIEEQKMVPEGFAAVVLLRESVNRRAADPTALRELRDHLKSRA